jgi:hypothetical protein
MPRTRWLPAHGRAAVLLLAVVGGAAACSPAVVPDDAPSATLSPLESAADSARAGGADAAQVAVLESGTVEFEDYESAMNRAYECMRAGGVEVVVHGVTPHHGVTVLDVAIESSPEADALADDCYHRHAEYVDAYWQVSSPDAVAYDERRAVALTPPLRQCLTEHDIDWPKDASFTELSNLAFGPGTDPAANCLDEIGYSEWDG